MSDINELFVQYFKERESLETIYNDFGFIMYGVVQRDNGKFALLRDFFVLKSERGKGEGKLLFDKFLDAVRQQNCLDIFCNIAVADPNAVKTLPIALSKGFKVIRADNGVLNLKRSVENGANR